MLSVDSGQGLRAFLLAAFAGAVIGVLFPATSNADFFDELFGFDQRPASPRNHQFLARANARRHTARTRSHVTYWPAYRHERPRKAHVAYITEAATGSRPVEPAFCSSGIGPKQMSSRFRQLLRDSTLRSGDIVVTEAGLRVFQGRGGCPHKPDDFLAVASADLSKVKRRALTDLEVMQAIHGHDKPPRLGLH